MYVRPNAYTDATAISADDIRENHEAARDFLNRGIRVGDFEAAALDWTHIQPGEYQPVTRDHRFTTGNFAQSFVDSDQAHQTAVGVTMKTGGPDYALFHPICGKRDRVVGDPGMALVSCYLKLLPFPNDASAATGASTDGYLFLDGEKVDGSQMRFFSADTPASPGGDCPAGDTARYREGATHVLLTGLSAGYHDFELRIDPKHDLAYVLARSIIVEIFEV